MWSLVRCLILLLALASAANAQRRQADTLVTHFAFDRSIVRQADSSALSRLAGHPADSILIIGNTDTTGSIAYNQRLSLRRALAIKNTLPPSLRAGAETHGAPEVPVRLEARGESDPLPGDDSLSRRVEVIIYYHLADTPVIAAAPRIDTPAARPDDEPDTTFGLDNINFIANTPNLTDASRLALPGNIPYLRSLSANRYLEILGFCNSPGPPLPKTDVLFILSIRRAKFIYDYLVDQGFDSTHLSYRGMGNASPINAHPTTAAEMDKNMRVEIRVFRKPPKP